VRAPCGDTHVVHLLLLLLPLYLGLLLFLLLLRLRSLPVLGPLRLERLSLLPLHPLTSCSILLFAPIGVVGCVCVCVFVCECGCVNVCVCSCVCTASKMCVCVRMPAVHQKFTRLDSLYDHMFIYTYCSRPRASSSLCFLSVSIRSLSWAKSFFSCSSASRCSCSILSRPARSSCSRGGVCVCVCVCVAYISFPRFPSPLITNHRLSVNLITSHWLSLALFNS